jgi:integrase
MGRIAAGWTIEWRRGIAHVRFTHGGHQHLLSTRTRDLGEAAGEAARLYARTVAGTAPRRVLPQRLRKMPLEQLCTKWLASLDGILDPETIATYETTYVGRHWLQFFGTLDDMIDPLEREAYRSQRLRFVTATTTKKECWALDKFLRWAKDQGILDAVPAPLEWTKRMTGTRSGPQRQHAQVLQEDQVHQVLQALPAWREHGPRARLRRSFPIRARFSVAYETSLRPSTLDELVWGDWMGPSLRLRSEDDKSRYGREVPISERAQATLEQLREEAAARGLDVGDAALVFGRHTYTKTLRRSAAAAGLAGIAPYDLRHSRGTHLADRGASLTGLGYLMGHTQVATTNRYLRASAKAARDALILGTAPGVPRIGLTKQGDRRVSNPRQLEPQSSAPLAVTDTYPNSADPQSPEKQGFAKSFQVPYLESSEGRTAEIQADAVRTSRRAEALDERGIRPGVRSTRACVECGGSGTVVVLDSLGEALGTSCSSCALRRGAA